MTATIPTFPLGRFQVVAIGSSTGGPSLVETIVAGLPADLPVPILVAQHLPASFSPGFAAQLDRAGPLTAVLAEEGMPVYPGTVYVGPGKQHLRIRRAPTGPPRIEVSPLPAGLIYKPSVDELFSSCAQVYGRHTLAVVLSGIGSDGTRGAGVVRALAGVVLTQEAATCAVYGMPRSCVLAGLSDAALTPDQIRQAILQLAPSRFLSAR